MNITTGARVRTDDIEGTVMTRHANGICVVKWDSGIAERIHESELKTIGAPPYETASGKVLMDADIEELAREAEEGYEITDPKHPTFRERLSALWDMRPGK